MCILQRDDKNQSDALLNPLKPMGSERGNWTSQSMDAHITFLLLMQKWEGHLCKQTNAGISLVWLLKTRGSQNFTLIASTSMLWENTQHFSYFDLCRTFFQPKLLLISLNWILLVCLLPWLFPPFLFSFLGSLSSLYPIQMSIKRSGYQLADNTYTYQSPALCLACLEEKMES